MITPADDNTLKAVAVIEAAYFGGRCEKLCGASPSDWSCAAGLTPVRLNASGADGAPCLSTTCLPPTEALFKLARGNYEVWRLGRHNRTGMYIDHVDPLLPYASQQWTMASADGAGPGLAIECVAAALGLFEPSTGRQALLDLSDPVERLRLVAGTLQERAWKLRGIAAEKEKGGGSSSG